MKPAIKEVPLPKYIAIEGPIGVGKTTLANKIATTFIMMLFLNSLLKIHSSRTFIGIQVNQR